MIAFLFGLACGTALGASLIVAAVYFYPTKAKETIQDLVKKAKALVN